MESTKPQDHKILTLEQIIQMLSKNELKNIVVVQGPGIGMPDFKSEHNLEYFQKEFLRGFNLPNKESLFDIEFFKKSPDAFYSFASNFLVTQYSEPTAAHQLV